jgi:hypothetical protein
MITFNISGLDSVIDSMQSIDTNKLCRDIASTLKAKIRHRVHIRGEASDGSQIGIYSKGYMKVRTGNYPETKIKKGKNKGKFKEKKEAGEAGLFSKGKKKGMSRPIYNRKSGNNDTKVILSLTSQMENDMDATHPIPIQDGYGIGYSNEFNYNKAIWNEKRYKKPIWNLTKEEKDLAESIVSKYVDEINR